MNATPHLIAGRYEVGELLGRGGMAEVRKGVDLRLGRAVAVKRLRTDLASDATFQARFRREAQSSAALNHPAIVAVYDTGEEMATDGSDVAQPYIVMEFVEGRTLRDILREGRKILPERALEIGDLDPQPSVDKNAGPKGIRLRLYHSRPHWRISSQVFFGTQYSRITVKGSSPHTPSTVSPPAKIAL